MLRKSASFFDQLVVSGGNFALTIFLARALSTEDFGFFSISWLIVISLASLIQAVFIAPMLSLTPKFSEVDQKRFCSLLFLELIITITLLSSCILSLFFIAKYLNYIDVTTILFGLLFLSPSYYLYEFLRRDLMLRGENLFLLISDILCYGLILATILLSETIELNSVFLVVSSCFTLTIVVLSFKSRFELFRVIKDFKSYRSLVIKQYDFSKWLVKSSILQFFNGNAYVLITGFFLGVAQVAYLKMAQNIVGIINPIYVFLDNHAQLYLAKTRFEKGEDACNKEYVKIVIACMSCLILVLSTIYIFRTNIILFIYDEQPDVIYVYLALMLVLSAFTGANFLQRLIIKVREDTKVIYKSYVYSSVLSLLAVYPLITLYGGLAAVQAMIIAQAVMLFVLLSEKNKPTK
ncbi:lipopolysaccharide biosynthesis protein [Colwellia sp. MB02u-6]|uniref:lipopolysaccharide biosynthesis protein n=1 Tax=Colwellia sp. MB02u-6 TaxID=2759824 RepID=UPI0015F407A7|nr:lipopolysaccharide biosynthesis protein [Colwellia sp. MB02u-6]MBA6328368.1 lipopolysaccharide biosynthesis protein [Colwellia sp. MB02u-6]